jgi:parvulin-like peptidyl-prolyl isomerase
MKRPILAAALCFLAVISAMAQTSIDKPAATLKLIRQEVISVRQYKSGVEKVEAAVGQKLSAEQRKQFLDKMIDDYLFMQYCEREKILVSDAEVGAALAQMKSSLGPGADDAKLEIALRGQGIFLDAKTYAKEQLLLQSYLKTRKADELKAIQPPSSDEILKAYELYKSQLVRPDTLRVSVIFVDLRTIAGAEDKRKAADALRQAAGQIKGSSSKFDEVSLKAGDPGSLIKANSNFYIEKTPQAVATYGNQLIDAAFKMKAGEVSDLLENEAGLQILRVNEILPQKMLSLSDPLPGNPKATVQDYLKYVIGTQRQNEVLGKIQSDLHDLLRKQATVQIFSDNLVF